jgi:hypothetical protein
MYNNLQKKTDCQGTSSENNQMLSFAQRALKKQKIEIQGSSVHTDLRYLIPSFKVCERLTIQQGWIRFE